VGDANVRRLIFVLVAAATVAGAAVVSKDAEPVATRMYSAADRLVGTLDARQKAQALFTYEDSERTNWHFVPHQRQKKPLRKGLPLEQMTAEQKAFALRLLETGTSPGGYGEATTIMSLENLLKDLEKNGVNVRNPEWYFFSIFGTPSKTGKWGWRVEGHHLSVNFALDKGQLIGATPFFFGANPALVKAGSRKGLRTLPEAEDAARRLIDAFDDSQRKVARQPRQLAEIEEAKPAPRAADPVGLPASQMTQKQKAILRELLRGYAARMPAEAAAAEIDRLQRAGVDKVHFAYARDDEKPGQPYTYRVQGPTFLVEFLNVQSDSANNPANHIHSVWRDLPVDFGMSDH
jgi:hypothetical protein